MNEYTAPDWARGLSAQPAQRLSLARLPTPVQSWGPTAPPDNIELWIKRDDMTGITLSGNKARKLEFLLADAVAQECDTIITAGGIQSNHARATAIAARELGLDSHLVLCHDVTDRDPGLAGNLLLDRLVAARIHLVTIAQFMERNEDIMYELAEELIAEGRKPYIIPVGGSNAIGTWGYIEAIREILEESDGLEFDDIVFACGSGGTAAGLALGVELSGMKAQVHAVNVCRDAAYFYEQINAILRELGANCAAEDIIDVMDGYVGRGYAMSRPEELNLLRNTAQKTGIILDPVYTGKAFYGLCNELEKSPKRFRGNRVLFIHTGGLFGLYDKLDELAHLLEPV